MFLDLTKLDERGRLEERFEIGPDHEVLDGFRAEVREPLVLDAELVNPSGRTYVLNARLSGIAFAPCRRCLTPVGIPIDHQFRVVYQEPPRGEEPEGEDDEDAIAWIDRGATKIEIDRAVRDRLFLESERFPLCDEECAGLCPVCGVDRNEEDCDCVVETVDARWQALEEFRSEMGESS
ncbi:MAG: DUF177 domain-containing protein [Gemmatimonadota bacterium]|nr:DUF177 domain-containing protein [Gemmatimonadota bacterium]